MDLSDTKEVNCPYCGEAIELVVDYSAGSQEYVEDCSVCCRPIVVTIAQDRGRHFAVHVRAEGE